MPHSDLIAIDDVQIVEYDDPEHGRLLIALVGDMQIPLGADTPVLRMSELLYIVPAPEDPSFSYGIKLPGTSSSRTVDAFERMLRRDTQFKVSDGAAERREPARLASADTAFVDPSIAAEVDAAAARHDGVVVAEQAAPRNRLADNRAVVARGKATGSAIERGAQTAAAGILAGAAWLGQKLQAGAESAKGVLAPAEQPVEVSDATRQRVGTARNLASGMVTMSAAVVQGAYQAADAMASNIAEAVKDTDAYKQRRGQAGPKTQAALEVGRSTVTATLAILTAMEEAGVHLLKETTDAAVVVARHKYGDEVGDVSAEAAAATTDVGRAAVQFSRVGVRSIAKRTVKGATRELGDDVAEESAGARLAIEEGGEGAEEEDGVAVEGEGVAGAPASPATRGGSG